MMQVHFIGRGNLLFIKLSSDHRINGIRDRYTENKHGRQNRNKSCVFNPCSESTEIINPKTMLQYLLENGCWIKIIWKETDDCCDQSKNDHWYFHKIRQKEIADNPYRRQTDNRDAARQPIETID